MLFQINAEVVGNALNLTAQVKPEVGNQAPPATPPPAPQPAFPPIKLMDGNNFQGFYGFHAMTECPPIDTSELTNFYSLFYNCLSMTKLPDSLDYSNATSMAWAFANTAITEVDEIIAPKVTSIEALFSGSRNLVHIGRLELPLATNWNRAFENCTALERVEYLDVSSSNVTINLAYSPRLSKLYIKGLKCSLNLQNTQVPKEDIMAILNDAQQAIVGSTITAPRALARAFSPEEMQVATQKGFNLTFR